MSGERPIPGPPTIGVEGTLEVLRELLRVERARLVVALEIEAKRSIVFPETTVICRDVERLVEKVARLERGEVAVPVVKTAPSPRRVAPADSLGDLLASVGMPG